MLHRHASGSPRALLILGAAIAICGCANDAEEQFRTVTEADLTREREQVATIADRRPPDSGADLETSPQTRAGESEVAAAGTDAHRSPEDSRGDVPSPQIRVLIPKRQFAPEGRHGVLRVSFDDFDLEKVLGVTIPEPGIAQHFPDWLNDLEGRRIRVRGFMVPPYREEGLTNFTLARDTEVCCFGPRGKIYHVVSVALRAGETTDHIYLRPFDVEGTFRIVPLAFDGELLQLYQLDDAVMIER
jgi:hypothetical protein